MNKKKIIANTLITLGLIQISNIIIQAAYRLGLKLESEKDFIIATFVICIPLGFGLFFLIKENVKEMFLPIAIIITIYIINFATMIVYTVDTPWNYVKENLGNLAKTFAVNNSFFMPIIVGYLTGAFLKYKLDQNGNKKNTRRNKGSK